MSINSLLKDECCGCYGCYNVCPVQCITMKADQEGFAYPEVDVDNCINCDKCEKVCPSINIVKENMDNLSPLIYAAWSLNEKIRLESTSGGIFTELALSALNQGYYICGAQYGKYHHIEHIIVKSYGGIDKLRQSKYAQSDLNNVYTQIKILLDSGEKVLFCGTPCEGAAIRNFLGKIYAGLLIIDFVCLGVNSPKVYKKFLEMLEGRYGSKIRRVWFKNKTYGWNRFSTKIEFENGKEYLQDRYHDVFIRGYIEYCLYMRPSCEKCNYKVFPRVSDITLADFWGIELNNKSMDPDKGTSLVILNTNKGINSFKKIKAKIFYEEKELSDAIGGNPRIYHSVKMSKKRKYFFDNLDKLDFDILMNNCMKMSYKQKAVKQIKIVWGKFIGNL